MQIDLDGTKNQSTETKYSIPVDSYEAILTDVSEPFMAKGYEETDPEVEKVALTFSVNLPEGIKVTKFEGDKKEETKVEQIDLKLYATAKISKGSGKYSNSKMYDIIDTLGLMEQLKKDAETIGEDSALFVKWLKEKAVNAVVKVMIKNSKTSGISRVSDINRLINNPNITKEEKIE